MYSLLVAFSVLVVLLLLACDNSGGYQPRRGGSCTVKPDPTEAEMRDHAEWRKKNPIKGQGKRYV